LRVTYDKSVNMLLTLRYCYCKHHPSSIISKLVFEIIL